MPVFKPRRSRAGVLKLCTAGIKGGVASRLLTRSASQKVEEHIQNREVLLHPPLPSPNQSNSGCADFAVPLNPNSQFTMEAASTSGAKENEEHLPPIMKKCRRKRNKASEREHVANNWVAAENRIVEILCDNIPKCNCLNRETVEVRFISLEDYVIRNVEYCICGFASSQLVEKGFFPSAPIKPRTVFSSQLLETLHEQSVRTSISKYGWGEGLRAAHEKRMCKSLKPFFRLLGDAYHHFIAVQNKVLDRKNEELTKHELAATSTSHNWAVNALSNMCPACFDASTHSGDHSAAITIDGNFQQKRNRDRSSVEWEVLIPKTFVDYQRRDYSLASEGIAEHGSTDGCSNNFKATGGWKRSELTTVAKKALDETGLMAATCFHGIAIRYLNIHRTGERQTHSVALLRNILNELPHLKKLRLCYDVACTFGPALTRLMPDESQKIICAIGRFHIYAHKYQCHINFSTLRQSGFGLMRGEEPEINWSLIAHLVSINRNSTGPRRTQNIDSCALFNVVRFQESFGLNLERRWKAADEMEKKEHVVLLRVLRLKTTARRDKSGVEHPAQVVTVAYLREQARDQHRYYENFRELDKQPGDELYAALVDEYKYAHDYANPHRNQRNAPKNNPPISLEVLATFKKGKLAINKTNDLFAKVGSTRQDPDWYTNGSTFLKFQQRATQKSLHILQSKIIHCITEREAELNVLHRRIGQAAAQKFLTAINGRWKALEQLVKEYNKEVVTYNRTHPDRKLTSLDLTQLKLSGLDTKEIWEIDLVMSRADWAVFDYVREGIEAVCRLDRITEERAQLQLHSARMVSWLSWQLDILLHSTPDHLTKILILHRYRVILSLLSIQKPIVTRNDQSLLWNLRLQIETQLAPHQISVQDNNNLPLYQPAVSRLVQPVAQSIPLTAPKEIPSVLSVPLAAPAHLSTLAASSTAPPAPPPATTASPTASPTATRTLPLAMAASSTARSELSAALSTLHTTLPPRSTVPVRQPVESDHPIQSPTAPNEMDVMGHDTESDYSDYNDELQFGWEQEAMGDVLDRLEIYERQEDLELQNKNEDGEEEPADTLTGTSEYTLRDLVVEQTGEQDVTMIDAEECT